MGCPGTLHPSGFWWSRLLFCFGVVFLGLRGVSAQTDTPSSTLTRTATRTPNAATFTPGTPTETPSGNRFLCPEGQVFSSDVSFDYLNQCSHCVTYITPTPVQVSNGGLPSIGLPITALFTATATPTGIWFPRTSTPSPFLTVYPSATPPFVSTDFISPTPSITPSPTPLFTATPGLITVQIDFNDAAFSNSHGWVLEDNANENYSYVLDNDFPESIFNPYTGTSIPLLGFLLRRLTTSSQYIISIDYDYTQGNRGCTVNCGNAPAFQLSRDDFAVSVLTDDWQIGFPGFHNTYVEGQTLHRHIDVNDFVREIQAGVTLFGSDGAFPEEDYISNLEIVYLQGTGDEPTPEPSATFTPTITLTPSGYIDCRNVDSRYEDIPLADTDAFDGLNAVSRTCFTLIDPSFVVDLTGLNGDWLLNPDDLEVCIVIYRVPTFSLFGVNLPLDMLLSVTIIAYLIRTLRSY